MGQINDDFNTFLENALGKLGQNNDLYFEYLRGLGFTGSLQDMISSSGLGISPIQGGGAGGNVWILANNSWNDSGVWQDNNVWKD